MKKHLIAVFALISCTFISEKSNAQTSNFNYNGTTQSYIVPAGVAEIQITAVGAAGGMGESSSSGVGGNGASIEGTFTVVPGQELIVLVGQQGFGAQYVAGGGGGSFIWDNSSSTLLVAAGGGGGGGSTDGSDAYIDGTDATVLSGASNGAGITDGAGINGNGGVVPASLSASYYASGGAGWNTNGSDGTVHGCTTNSTGGLTPLNGGDGGSGGGSTDPVGGYGGGGGGNGRCGAVGGGGGGGYSGGGAGGEAIEGDFNGGGGGGSFNGGSNQSNTAGVGTSNGSVTISAVAYVGVNEIDAIQVGLFPNPASDKVTVSTTEEVQSIEILSVTGQVITEFTATNSIDISELNSGIYMVRVTTVNNKMAVKRLVKK